MMPPSLLIRDMDRRSFVGAGALGVLGFPTLVFFKDGNEVGRIFGAMKKGRLIEAIRKNLGI